MGIFFHQQPFDNYYMTLFIQLALDWIYYQSYLKSPTMWGRAKTAFQLSVLLLMELPIHLLMLLVINIVGLVLPEVVVWMARTIMIRHARSEGMSDLEAKWKKIQTIQDFAFILSLDSVTMEVKGKMRDILKAAQLGEPAPNLELVDLATKTKLHLLSLAKAGRPFVVNFGSGS